MQQPVQEAWRVLKPGEYLMISTPFNNSRHTIRDSIIKRWDACFGGKAEENRVDDSSYARFYLWRFSYAGLFSELKRGGFELEKVKPIHAASGMGRFLTVDFKFEEGSILYKTGFKTMSLTTPFHGSISNLVF